jgi:hypothetical protein
MPLEPADSAEFIPVPTRIRMLLVVILPFLGLIAGIVLLWGRGFSWV